MARYSRRVRTWRNLVISTSKGGNTYHREGIFVGDEAAVRRHVDARIGRVLARGGTVSEWWYWVDGDRPSYETAP